MDIFGNTLRHKIKNNKKFDFLKNLWYNIYRKNKEPKIQKENKLYMLKGELL